MIAEYSPGVSELRGGHVLAARQAPAVRPTGVSGPLGFLPVLRSRRPSKRLLSCRGGVKRAVGDLDADEEDDTLSPCLSSPIGGGKAEKPPNREHHRCNRHQENGPTI